ncbi:MarR family winged helix-turn-helix transcriptional regulator [Flexivirga caeni]|uniref:MarR family transcriptional regulator n=1 Tax=Flexivirga caeni TaxID=2294115 RepID=A0A3M9MCE8_9MICO|nr:MarR family transcriptional regulator [Flexivirga caeni]RNI23239.1 MarR family transcriptional regulator [Flexivirga caeni]
MRSRADELVTSLLTASRALVGVSAASLSTVEHTVTLPQFRTLVVLSQQGGSTVVGLAGRLQVNPSSAQRQVDRLVGTGLVARAENPADRRELVITLTAAGQQVVDEVTRRRRTVLAAIVRAMPPEQYDSLIEGLESFTRAAGEPAATDAAALGW